MNSCTGEVWPAWPQLVDWGQACWKEEMVGGWPTSPPRSGPNQGWAGLGEGPQVIGCQAPPQMRYGRLIRGQQLGKGL